MSAFHVDPPLRFLLAVTLGLVTPSSQLRFHFRTIYNLNIKHDTAVVVDISAQTMTHLYGDPQDLKRFKVIEKDGRISVEVSAAWPDSAHPKEAIYAVRCDAEILLTLDEKLTVPINGPFKFFVGGVQGPRSPGPTGPSHSSYD